MPPKKTPPLVECITLKAFHTKHQEDCKRQLSNPDDLKKIAGSTFTFPRSLIHLEDDEVNNLYSIRNFFFN